MGRRAVDLLLALVRGESPPLRQIVLPTELVVRGSTGVVRAGSPARPSER
jgi:LacI family repressor for deo operon, udp, cdd, tsx, nupC, and nupG